MVSPAKGGRDKLCQAMRMKLGQYSVSIRCDRREGVSGQQKNKGRQIADLQNETAMRFQISGTPCTIARPHPNSRRSRRPRHTQASGSDT